MYGLALRHGAGESCEDAAVKELTDLLKLVRASPRDKGAAWPAQKAYKSSVLVCRQMVM